MSKDTKRYRINRTVSTHSWTELTAENEATAIVMATENDVWHGDDTDFNEEFEVEEA